MENATMDTIIGSLAEMRLIVEGAVSIYEKEMALILILTALLVKRCI